MKVTIIGVGNMGRAIGTRALAGGHAVETNGVPLDVPITGDDAKARQQVATIVDDGGMRPIQLGPLRRAQQMEHAMFFLITARQRLGAGSETALKILA